MQKYYKYKILRIFGLISKEKFKEKTAKYTGQYKTIARSKYFNKKWYLEENPDVKKAGCNPVQHYLEQGWKEGRNPSEEFDGNAYLDANDDVKNAEMNPLLHYESNGEKEGRPHFFQKQPEQIYRFCLMKALVFYIEKFISIFYKRKDNPKILVCLHLYYMESWGMIHRYLKNLKPYNHDLIVSYTLTNYNEKTLNKIKEAYPNVTFYGYENNGFDLGPFMDVLRKVDLSQYDIVYKLHSKGVKRPFIFIYGNIFKYKDWFFNLYNGILSPLNVHKTVEHLMGDEKCGIVAAKNLIVKDPLHKQYFVKKACESLNVPYLENYNFVAGTCFAIKAQLLQPIKDLNLTIDDFQGTRRGEFSLAHAIERIMCFVEVQNYHACGNKVVYPKYRKELEQSLEMSSLRLLNDDRFCINYDFFYKALEHKKIVHYEVVDIQLKKIRRKWLGEEFRLQDTHAYKYLLGDVSNYEEYCAYNAQISKFDMSSERFDNLLNAIKTTGFDEKYMPVIGKTNVIYDGQHRCCALLYLYGEDYPVKVLRITTARKSKKS